jgi:hypothetical protein
LRTCASLIAKGRKSEALKALGEANVVAASSASSAWEASASARVASPQRGLRRLLDGATPRSRRRRTKV